MPSRARLLSETPEPAAAAVPRGVRHAHVHHRVILPLVTAAGVAVALTVFFSAALAVLLYRRCSRHAVSAKPSPAATASSGSPLRRFTYAQLRRDTASFSPSGRLGQGGFGPVFRGVLRGGQQVAVKLMDSGSLQGEREFQNELSLAETILNQPSIERKWVVAPFGFCIAEKRRRRRRFWRWRRDNDNTTEANLNDGDDEDASRRLLLVYELMHNGSLQDALLDRRCPELMEWARRFAVMVDVSRGLCFLHCVCSPPVIHGDIKPSNILLDSSFSARIADLGLSRIKSASLDDHSVETNLKETTKTSNTNNNLNEDDASVMGETVADSTSTTYFEETAGNGGGPMKSPEDLEVASTSEATGFDRMSVDSMNRRSARRKSTTAISAKDWWWRQDTGGGGAGGGGNSESGGSVKDYVMEWIKSEIKKERPRSDWISPPAVSADDCLPKLSKPVRKKQQRRMEWWATLDEDKSKKEKKSRQPREWWREEYCDELTNKHRKRNSSNIDRGGEQWWQKNDDDDDISSYGKRKGKKRCRSRGSRTSLDIPKSGAISSTPSMRGTVCYVAPEYGGGGPLSEKCDIYSFGVLLLVLISGRRPLQMTASPMSEFERANLISWARHLARLGKLLDLLDSSLQNVDRDQAVLCITVALLCIQKLPGRRPSIKDIVAMLTGQMEAPNLPMEFSPSPPGGFSFKSRKKPAR